MYKRQKWNLGFYYKVCGTLALREDKDDEILIVFDMSVYEKYPLSSNARISTGVDDEEDLNRETVERDAA